MEQRTTFHVAGACFLLLFLVLGYIVKYRISLLAGFDQSITEIDPALPTPIGMLISCL